MQGHEVPGVSGLSLEWCLGSQETSGGRVPHSGLSWALREHEQVCCIFGYSCLGTVAPVGSLSTSNCSNTLAYVPVPGTCLLESSASVTPNKDNEDLARHSVSPKPAPRKQPYRRSFDKC